MPVLARLRSRLSSFQGRPPRPPAANDESLEVLVGPGSAEPAPSRLHPDSAFAWATRSSSRVFRSLSTPTVNELHPSGPAPPVLPLEAPASASASAFARSVTQSKPQSTTRAPSHAPARAPAPYDPSQRSLSGPKPSLAALYPPLDPYEQGLLRVSDIHQLHWAWSGNPEGTPALVLPDAPGAACTALHPRLLDPAHYRVLSLDLRGCGQSIPLGETSDNTTAVLIDDLERVRTHFHLDRWLILGTNWGASLALAYAQAHPKAVSALVLAGVGSAQSCPFWASEKGAAHLFPDMWETFLSPLPPGERAVPVKAYHALLSSPEAAVQRNAASYWIAYKHAVSSLYIDPSLSLKQPAPASEAQIAQAKLETYYITNKYFLPAWDASTLASIRQIPAWIVQGRYDVLSPASAAWDLHRLWPEASLTILPDTGHSPSEPGMSSALITATNLYQGLVVPKSIKARSRGPSSHAHARAAYASPGTQKSQPARPTPPSSSLKTPSLSGSSVTSSRYSPLRVTGEAAYKRASRLEPAPSPGASLRPSAVNGTAR